MSPSTRPAACPPWAACRAPTWLSWPPGGAKRAKDRILFLDPGFPVNKRQVRLLGLPHDRFDLYDYRGRRLGPKLEACLQGGDVAAVLYSTPNNPSWICLSEEELATTGSRQEGIRVCVSRTAPDQFELLARRLARFQADHRNGR